MKTDREQAQFPYPAPPDASQIRPNGVLSSIIQPYLNHGFTASAAVWYIASQGGPDGDLQ